MDSIELLSCVLVAQFQHYGLGESGNTGCHTYGKGFVRTSIVCYLELAEMQ